jgi:hypothetical protein
MEMDVNAGAGVDVRFYVACQPPNGNTDTDRRTQPKYVRVTVEAPPHLSAALRSGGWVLRPGGAALVPPPPPATVCTAAGCGVPLPFPALWRTADLGRLVDRVRRRIQSLRFKGAVAAADGGDDLVELCWLNGVLFRLGCAVLRHGDSPLARDCFAPERPSVRRDVAIMPEVARRLERQRDALHVASALGGATTGADAGSAPLRPRGGAPQLRGSTVTTKYHAMAEALLRELAWLGESFAVPGADGNVVGWDVRVPRFKSGLFYHKPRNALGAAVAFVAAVEQTKRQSFDAARCVWRAAYAIQDFHRAMVACHAQVRRHADRVLQTPTGAETTTAAPPPWIEALCMLRQTESMCFLHAVAIDTMFLLLRMDLIHPRERATFRQSIFRSLLCISQRIHMVY